MQRKRLLSAATVSLLTLLAGLAATFWHARATVQREASLNATKVLGHIELMLGNARSAAMDGARWSNLGCSQALPLLRERVQATLYVRSLNLVDRQGRLYCSSLLGNTDDRIDASLYAEGQLRLLHGNTVTPDTPVLLYRHASPDGAVLVGIDGRHVSNLMTLVPGAALLRVGIGQSWLENRRFRQTEGAPVAPITVHAPDLPVSVYSAFPPDTIAQTFWRDYIGLLLLFFFLSLLSGAHTYWLTGRRRSARAEMTKALAQLEFIPYLQPLIAADTLKWVGVEVLARWQHPDEGLVSPSLFVPAAEKNGLILPITRSLMQQVATGLSRAPLPAAFQISINISKAHLLTPAFVADCCEFLESFPPGRIALTLELTEREFIISDKATLEAFSALRERGIRFAIDDFGTGYSSLSYLQEFDVDALKIDRAFVSRIGENDLSQALVLNILDLGDRLGLKTVAEGVETEPQSQFLRAHRIDLLQGFLFSPPLSLDAFIKLLPGRS